MATCNTCRGSRSVKCPKCRGEGTIRWDPLFPKEQRCENCHGSGQVRCGACDGKGST